MQFAHQLYSARNRDAKVSCSVRQVAVMDVVRQDAVLDETAHQRFQSVGIVVDAAKQHRLTDERRPRIRNARERRPGGWGEFAGVIGMKPHDHGLAGLP